MDQPLEYEYKAMKKVLKQKYPWIKDIIRSEDSDVYSSIRPVDIIVDKEKFVEDTGIEFPEWAEQLYQNNSNYRTSFFQGVGNKDNDELAKELYNDVERIMVTVHKNPIIPQEFKTRKTPRISYIVFTK